MPFFYTSPDVLWERQDIEGGFYQPTIYKIEADVRVDRHVDVVDMSRTRVLDTITPSERLFLSRPCQKEHNLDALSRLLRFMPKSARDFTPDSTSNRQYLWSDKNWTTNIGELRFIMRRVMTWSVENQFPPFWQYYTDIDPLLEALEATWRKLDRGDRSSVLWQKWHTFYSGLSL